MHLPLPLLQFNHLCDTKLKLKTPKMSYRPSTAHSFCIQDRLYLPCSIATTLHPPTTYMHINMHYTPSNTLPNAFHNPPPRNLETEYGYYNSYLVLLNLSMCHQSVVWNFVPDCVRNNLRGCKLKFFVGGVHAPKPPLVCTHAFHTLLSPCCHLALNPAL